MFRSTSWVAEASAGTLRGPNVALTGSVETDSRECSHGSLYVARVGENADGHSYAEAAVERGASAVMVERVLDLPVPQILVTDATVALGLLAKAYLRELRESQALTVIGITGSAGKTTTKDLLGQVLSKVAPTVFPERSYNNEVGCPLTVLRADETTRYLVLEMGASGPGHVRYLTEIAPLDVAVELIVGRAHLGGFGSVEVLANSKQELVEGLLPTGVAVLNQDDPNVLAMAKAAPGEVLTFSANGEAGADVWAEDVETGAGGEASFQLCEADARVPVTLNLVGEHQVTNALAAAAGAVATGMGLSEIAQAVNESKALSPHRMSVHPKQVIGDATDILLIDDSYNANPDSMAAGLRAAAQLAGENRLISVLGEMLELGPESEALHRGVGEVAGQVANTVIAVGEGARAVLAALPEQVTSSYAQDAEEALNQLTATVGSGDTVFLKGSFGSGVWQIAEAILQGQERSRPE